MVPASKKNKQALSGQSKAVLNLAVKTAVMVCWPMQSQSQPRVNRVEEQIPLLVREWKPAIAEERGKWQKWLQPTSENILQSHCEITFALCWLAMS